MVSPAVNSIEISGNCFKKGLMSLGMIYPEGMVLPPIKRVPLVFPKKS